MSKSKKRVVHVSRTNYHRHKYQTHTIASVLRKGGFLVDDKCVHLSDGIYPLGNVVLEILPIMEQ